MKCVNCGGETGDGEFCINCGARLSAQRTIEKRREEEHLQKAAAGSGVSQFDGTGLQIFGMTALSGLLLFTTLFLTMPWVVCMWADYFSRHSKVGGRSVKFTGSGGDFAWTYFKGLILSFITLGIYSFWFVRDIARYIASKLELA
jgi:uncharacterized membrane protein YjgN (DUF898 family)